MFTVLLRFCADFMNANLYYSSVNTHGLTKIEGGKEISNLQPDSSFSWPSARSLMCLIVTDCVCTSCPTRVTNTWPCYSRASLALTAKDAKARLQPSHKQKPLRTNLVIDSGCTHTHLVPHTKACLSLSACVPHLLTVSQWVERQPV